MANGNQSGFGTPGTQQRARQNVAGGGATNPYMPVGQQLAKQGASSYQQSLVPGAATQGVTFAQQVYPGPSQAAGGAAASKPSPLSGFDYQEALGMNKSLGFSNLDPGVEPAPGFERFGQQGPSPYSGPLKGAIILTPEEAAAKDAWIAAETEKATGAFEEAQGNVQSQQPETVYRSAYPKDSPYQGMEDVPGIDPEEYAKMEQALIDNAEFAYQQGISGLSRQYAMMGMTGSGANIAANNALMAQISDQLLREQSALAMANQQQIELDMAEKFDNALALSQNAMAEALQGAKIDHLKLQDSIAAVTAVNEQLGTTLMIWWDELGMELTPDMASAYMWIVSESMNNGDINWASDRLAELAAGQPISGWPGMGTESDPGWIMNLKGNYLTPQHIETAKAGGWPPYFDDLEAPSVLFDVNKDGVVDEEDRQLAWAHASEQGHYLVTPDGYYVYND